jgi:putative membrane protein
MRDSSVNVGELRPVDRFSLHFSNERTFLAWIRTATALMGFGYAVARFALYLADKGEAHRTSVTYIGGLAMTLAGMIALVLSASRYRANARGIERGGSPRTHEGYLYTFAALIGITGILLVILLLGDR